MKTMITKTKMTEELDKFILEPEIQVPKISSFLPIEKKLWEKIDCDFEKKLNDKELDIKMLDLSFLSITIGVIKKTISWENKESHQQQTSEIEIRVPKYMVFSLFKESIFCNFEFNKILYNRIDWTTKDKSLLLLSEYLFANTESRLTTTELFPNVILPEDIKENINKYRKFFDKKGLFLIRETSSNDWNKTQYIPNIDPFIVGIKNDKCYLLASFDMSENETNILKKFAC